MKQWTCPDNMVLHPSFKSDQFMNTSPQTTVYVILGEYGDPESDDFMSLYANEAFLSYDSAMTHWWITSDIGPDKYLIEPVSMEEFVNDINPDGGMNQIETFARIRNIVEWRNKWLK